MNGTSRYTTSIDISHTAANTNHQPLRSPSPSQQEQLALGRQNSEISLYDQKLIPSRFADDIGNAPWTRKQWESLELWYDKMDRDCQKASAAFYNYESTGSESDHPLWSKEYILWRCQCLDTNTRYHCGVLPSERKRRKDLRRRLRKQNLLKRQSSLQLQQHIQQANATKTKGTNIFSGGSNSSNDVRNSNISET